MNVSMQLQITGEEEEEEEGDNLLGGGSGVRKIHEFHISRGFVSDSFIVGRTSRIIFRNINIVILKAKINILLPFGPLAIILHSVTGKQVMFFF